MIDLKQFLDERRAVVDSKLEDLLPAATAQPTILHEAMRYSVFSGGKRLRPVLCLSAAEAVDQDHDVALLPAAALELMHTYTLVHDDLPCMDDDDMRRGKPTVHKAFGEANAVLTGDALQALAFEVLSKFDRPGRYSAGSLCQELAQAVGSMGVVGGQVDDLATDPVCLSEQYILSVHERKTAVLFRASMRMGAMAGNTDPDALGSLTDYGMSLGLAFQITDDLLDESRQDEELSCLRFCDVETARSKAQSLIDKAHASLDGLPGITDPLHAIADFVLERTI